MTTSGRSHEILGFMMMDLKVYSMKFDVGNKKINVRLVDFLKEFDVLKVLHCDGLLVCVTKDLSSLIAWNPYLGLDQSRSILPRLPETSFQRLDKYALGYDINRRYKILRFIDDRVDGDVHVESEIYDFSSDSWRVLEPTPNLHIDFYQRDVSLKGVSYFYSKVAENAVLQPLGNGTAMARKKVKDYLVSFDFTTEKFGERVPLPFESAYGDTVTLSCVRQAQLAILHYHCPDSLEFWVTTETNPNSSSWTSWTKFLKVDTTPLTSTRFNICQRNGGSFFIEMNDVGERVAVVFGTNSELIETPRYAAPRYNTAFLLGEGGVSEPTHLGDCNPLGVIPLVCSSPYIASLVAINRKRKDRDDDDSSVTKR